ncbi:GNAT family N-acetyltransferase [Streptomyces sp. SID3343]|uniref:GNAT family N-acetyltransferase n=1 Tax=Streptomyces sp. SID3343 TaxID=2690260 RepID=UPI001370919E|nr:GNAT family N-acetyltransferase [Streptomyces sp. SID3343]MYW00036.1 GNAT family N-acetyltransferase [Streptomyces sp. SID3343]
MSTTHRVVEDVRIRHLTDDDWDGIATLEADMYTDSALSEERSALESRGRASPSTCFVLECDGRIAGYALALPYPEFRYPDLARPEGSVHRSSNLHLHDLVIAEDLRGRGWAKRLLHRLTMTAAARSHDRISLIAVGGSEPFWSANGFKPHHELGLAKSYGANAVYMSRAV